MGRLLMVTYHYVRDLPNTPYPKIKGLLISEFRRQLEVLSSRYQMATWESITEFLKGTYKPKRDMCYLTFDDGFRDHYENVLPILIEKDMTAAFFPITGCLEENVVASAHKNHFLMASLSFQDLYERFTRIIRAVAPNLSLTADPKVVQATYPWEEPEVATYKYYVNFSLPVHIREQVLDALFVEVFEDERAFAAELYMNWDQVQEMRRLGMTIGGHSHRHRALVSLSLEDQADDLKVCYDILSGQLPGADGIPFCYPYGMADSFTGKSAALVEKAGFCAAVTTIEGWDGPASDPYLLHRVDTREVEKF